MKPGKYVAVLKAELRKGKLTHSQLARKFRVSPSTVARHARQIGMKPKAAGAKRVAKPSPRNQLILSACSRLGQSRTADKFGVSKQRVSQIVQRWHGTRFGIS